MIKDWLQESNYTVIFTGAGMSTESGLPDFRSANKGLWKQHDPSKIASIDALNNNVDTFIDFYRERVLKVKEYGPHQGHYILAEWEQQGLVHSIITQNVDGFHQASGSKIVHELHGTLQKLHCQSCGKEYSSGEYVDNEYHCDCGGVLRPSIILFGEMLPQEAFQTAFQDAEKADLFIVLGSSLTVSPANQIPLIAKESGARLIIVNQEPTPYDQYADMTIHDQKIGVFLQAVANEGKG
ncbi:MULTISPECIES: NAD-dependent protein deacylase [Oceanobacillus]|uniref:NAD-dependent protein deacetylase n=1 Tax=Oceanobacillus kimchii TaxID=746691 RepID=A0ABQ5TM05_9BACI|nr:NAD-dependent protein deacylase [Oceanobacillus kimchii]MBT2599627.1 NAD-dependent protein deacylase [Oceanobacillus sp. ISL-74]GLO67853.1 NAD-dependent deacetylase [Oceanobacillus kimchii]